MRILKSIALGSLLVSGLIGAQSAYAIESKVVRDVKARLDQTYLGGHDITIENHRSEVRLSGFVSSREDMDRVVEATRSVRGVSHVHNNLTIREGVALRQTVDPLALRVRDKVEADRLIGNHRIKINAANGIVFLDGEVDEEIDRDRIESIARETHGVTAVQSALQVSQPPPDEVLEERVRASLEDQEGVNMQGIDIRADNGVVTFSGSRSNHRAIDRILSSALMVPGVRDIRSDMQIRAGGPEETTTRARMR